MLSQKRYGPVQFLERTHAAGKQDRQTGLRDALKHDGVGDFAGRDLPGRNAHAFQQVHGLHRERRTQKSESGVIGVLLQSQPLLFGKLHTSPVIITSSVLSAELDPPWFIESAFGRRDVGLELDRICAGCGYGIDEGMSHA